MGLDVVLQFERSVNKEKFCEFLVKLRAKYPFKKLAVFMDNLSVHKSNVVVAKMEELQILPIFNAAYYPDGNPIEFVFSIVKRHFKKQKLNELKNQIERSTESLIKDSFEKPTLS